MFHRANRRARHLSNAEQTREFLAGYKNKKFRRHGNHWFYNNLHSCRLQFQLCKDKIVLSWEKPRLVE